MAPTPRPDFPPEEWWKTADGSAAQDYIAYLFTVIDDEKKRRQELAAHVQAECQG